tara:strand:+ start:1077 stop:2210 length:1134 start_codon:yes stop_codon:yes gene_type:complete
MVKIALFLTYDYSIKTWHDTGTLEKELKIYKEISNNFPVTFTFFSYGDEEDYKYEKYFNEFEIVPIYALLSKSNSKVIRFIKSFQIPFLLKNKLKNCSIIQQHQLMGSWITIISKFLNNIPLYTRTGYDMYEFAIKENKSLLKQKFYKLLTSITLKNSDIYSVTSQCDFKFLKENFKTKNIKINIRPNWVDNCSTKKFSSRYKNKILTVGRMTEQKNYFYLLNEMKYISKNFELDIVGEGPLNQRLQDYSKENNLKVNFLGTINNENLLDLYQRYVFFVTASSFEGNPKTVLEAASSSCILLASDIPNHRELIKSGENGFLFELKKGNLSKLLSEIFEKNYDLNAISSAASKKVKENNLIDNLAIKYYQDYKNLLSI